MENKNSKPLCPPVGAAAIPILFLLLALLTCIFTLGAGSVLDLSPWLLLTAALIGIITARLTTRRRPAHILSGLRKSARQIVPAYPILLLIGTLSATWMISGVVPMLIDYGVRMLYPPAFLPLACIVCALISVVTGSSWTTIATIGVAFIGIGTVLGYPAAWVAGAIISGAYFGDKVSPLSDTTVLASSTVGVDLFTHIRNMMVTTVPAISLALIVYAIVGWFTPISPQSQISEITEAIRSTFNLSPWLLLVPVTTCTLIACRVNTVITLAAGTVAGMIAAVIFQPGLFAEAAADLWGPVAAFRIMLTGSTLSTGNDLLDPLLQTSGAVGMLPTVLLVTAAMIFGGVMIGSGMLASITQALIRRIHRPVALIASTVCGGCFLNTTTGDQYISLIIGGNLFHSAYRRAGLPPHTLSRTLEDSTSVTSVLIPWNSCGMTQSTVLGVSTVIYAPCCIFNVLSPIMSVVVAAILYRRRRPCLSLTPSENK
ncbi:MAG: sodium:proton antiporter [Paramuribaculum sp.]|nr:sodium:proton antiporter [Paramuribaculum sp.]